MLITRSDRMAGVSYAIRGPVADMANELESQGHKILKLNIGNPGNFGFNADESLLKAMRENFLGLEGGHSYSHSKGVADVREKIAEYHIKKGAQNISPNDVFIGNGASELITASMQALLNKGDEVLIPAPDYPLWTAAVNLNGGKAVHYICREENAWNPDVADIEAKITKKTRAIVVINPNNPTGANYSPEILKEIVAISQRYNLLIFADEIYDRILYDGEIHYSIAEFAGMHPCFTFNGISKTHLACGFRGGWLAVSGDKTHLYNLTDYLEGLTTLLSMRLCSNVPAQFACKAALEHDSQMKNYIVPGGRLYEQNTLATNLLNDIDGISCVKAKGALYLFPKIDVKKFNITNDQQFVLDFLVAKKALLVNGTGFNWISPDHFRVVFLPEVKVLEDAVGRLKEFLSTYRQK
jgi:alanine-synthesizing transaminase